MIRRGCRTIFSPDWSWRRCWFRLELHTRSHRACPASTACTQRSYRCWSTHCSAPAESSFWGPDSALAAVILGVVVPLSGGDPELRAATLAAMMAIVSGTDAFSLAGIGRLGFVTELLSKPIRYGYMNGIALTVLISQLPKFFGFSVESKGPLRDLWAIADAILEGKINRVAFGVGLGTLMVILLLKDSKRLPGILIAVVGATVAVAALDLGTHYGVKVLGPLPQGLPVFAIPLIGYDDLFPVLIGGCAIALVSFADTSVLSRAYAARLGTHVDPSQDGRAWRREPRNRLFSRLPDQQQRFAYPGCRSCRRPHPAHQRRRRACHRHPSAGGAKPASAFAHRCTGGRRHRRRDRPL